MSRPRFDALCSALQWSEQPKEIPEIIPHADHRWILIDDIVEIFIQHREEYFLLSEWICVYESISL